MEYQVVMPYIGGILTDNAYKYANRSTKPIVKIWKGELTTKVKEIVPEEERGIERDYRIHLFGRFTDERRPDLANLHKIIGDAVEKGLGVKDKHFFFVDEGYDLGYTDPELVITIEEV